MTKKKFQEKLEEAYFERTKERKIPVTTREYNPTPIVKDITRTGTFVYGGTTEPEFEEPEKELVYEEWTNWKEQDQLLVEYIVE